MNKITLTHKGWFGLCPVYMDDPQGKSESDGAWLEPRFPFTGWLIDLSAFIFDLMDGPGYPIRITGKLSEPIIKEMDDGECPKG